MLPTFTEQEVQLLVRWKPKGKYQRRLQLLVFFLLETGARISEESVQELECSRRHALSDLPCRSKSSSSWDSDTTARTVIRASSNFGLKVHGASLHA